VFGVTQVYVVGMDTKDSNYLKKVQKKYDGWKYDSSLYCLFDEYNILKDWLESTDGRLLLDAGCGWGKYFSLEREAGFQTVGVDISAKLLRDLKKRIKDADVVLADISFLPFKPKVFDITTCMFGPLNHTHNLKRTINELYGVTNKRIVASVYNYIGYMGYLWTFQKFAKLRTKWFDRHFMPFKRLFVPTSLISAFPHGKVMTLEGIIKPSTKNRVIMWFSKLLFIVIDI